MIIRPLNHADIDAVLTLNEVSVAVLSPLDRAALLQLIEQSELAVVVELSPEAPVVAFMIAVGPGSDYASINYAWFNQQYSDFLYIDRIVVDQQCRGQGIGGQLYSHINAWAQAHDIALLCAEIDIEPANTASLQFHQHWGFTPVSTLTHHPKKIVSLQTKSITVS